MEHPYGPSTLRPDEFLNLLVGEVEVDMVVDLLCLGFEVLNQFSHGLNVAFRDDLAVDGASNSPVKLEMSFRSARN